jgi:Glycosyltransferase like family 2
VNLLVATGTALAIAGTAHAAYNLRQLRVPPDDPPTIQETVSILLPARNEADRLGPCLRSLLAQRGVADLEILVLDDESGDATAAVAGQVAGADPRTRVLPGRPLPPGWIGKPHACAQLAGAAHGTVLVFVDADVVLAPHAVAAAVALLRSSGLDLVSPYPRQLTETVGERLVQPLLQWSWLTTLPLRIAETSPRPALSAANGQFLVVDAAAYARAGGHGAVRGEVLEDLALLRAVKRAGGRGGVVDGTRIAQCRMYGGWDELADGYAKSLWGAFGTPAGALGAAGLLGLAYVLPPLAALRGSRVGLLGYLAGVAGRAVVARRVGSRMWPDALAHPVSVTVFGALLTRSWQGHRRGRLQWKGRPLR